MRLPAPPRRAYQSNFGTIPFGSHWQPLSLGDGRLALLRDGGELELLRDLHDRGVLLRVEQPRHGAGDVLRVEPRRIVLLALRRGLDEGVRQHHRPHLEGAVIKGAVTREEVQHVIAEPADRALLHRQKDRVLLRQLPQEVNVERLHEARVRHRNAEVGVALLEGVRGLKRLAQTRTDRQDGHLGLGLRPPLPNDPALADLNGLPLLRHLIQFVVEQRVQLLDAVARAARVAHHTRHVVNAVRSLNHVHQLELVGRRHDDDVRQATHVRQVEAAVVGGAVVAHQTRAVQDHAHGQALDDNVVHHLVVTALHEG
mmetsp:Transcript_4878/g.9942  ORF Transcript_4878/g.9942 Transcript_4878/m.9942 type:complete len:313 (-) Transcript_4878:1273-2211(-)